jgi:hypothetical protein
VSASLEKFVWQLCLQRLNEKPSGTTAAIPDGQWDRMSYGDVRELKHGQTPGLS